MSKGIPFDVLERGITWDWETFPQFLSAARATPALNLAFLAPLTPLRHYVDGRGLDGARRHTGGDRTYRRRCSPRR